MVLTTAGNINKDDCDIGARVETEEPLSAQRLATDGDQRSPTENENNYDLDVSRDQGTAKNLRNKYFLSKKTISFKDL